MDDAIRKADVLIEALSYLLRFRDTRTVVKLGGSAMEDPDATRATLQDVVFLAAAGLRPVLVHGGGKPIDRAMAASGLQSRKVLGRRYTDDATLQIVVDVLAGEINREIVGLIEDLGGKAIGLHTGELQALHGERLTLDSLEGPVDLGRVGKVTRVEADLIERYSAGGVIPVIPCLAYDPAGGWLNVNGDTAAAAVAGAIQAEKLVFLTDTPGILRDRNDPESLFPSLDPDGCRKLMADGILDGGMIPKVEACLDALSAGVGKTHIIDGRLRHSLLLEIFTDRGVGTEIVLRRPPAR